MPNNTKPEIGMGATYVLWTDRVACTIIEIKRNGSQLVLQRDKATLLNGVNSNEPDALQFEAGGFVGHVSGTQRYEYEKNPSGQIYRVSKRKLKDGSVVWKTVGQKTKSPGGYAIIGKRSEYYDFNF